MAIRLRLSRTTTRILFVAIVSVSTLILLVNLLQMHGPQFPTDSEQGPGPHSSPWEKQMVIETMKKLIVTRITEESPTANFTSTTTTAKTSVTTSLSSSTTTTATISKPVTVATMSALKKNDSIPAPYDASSIRFVINEPDLCRSWRPDVFALIYVHTAPAHFKQRALIRRTFGDTRLYARLHQATVFMVGHSQDEHVARALALEAERHRDIVQADFVDSYRNLSVKALAAFVWIERHCSNATYVVKVDDDIFVNVFNLVRHLQVLSRHGSKQNSIHCLVWEGMAVIRNKNSKWYVSPAEFASDVYPPYCSGSAFFLRGELVPKLLGASRTVPFLWVDDAYATGMLAAEAGVPHNSITSIVSVSEEDYDKKLIEGECVFGHMSGERGLDMRYQYWRKLLIKEEWTASYSDAI